MPEGRWPRPRVGLLQLLPHRGQPDRPITQAHRGRLPRAHRHGNPPVAQRGIPGDHGSLRELPLFPVRRPRRLDRVRLLPPSEQQPLPGREPGEAHEPLRVRHRLADQRPSPGRAEVALVGRSHRRHLGVHVEVGLHRVPLALLDGVQLRLEIGSVRHGDHRHARVRRRRFVRPLRLREHAPGDLAGLARLEGPEVGRDAIARVLRRRRSEAADDDDRGERDDREAAPHDISGRGRVRQRSCIQNHCSGVRRMAASMTRVNAAV